VSSKGRSSRERSLLTKLPESSGIPGMGVFTRYAVIRLKLCWQSRIHRTDIARSRQDIHKRSGSCPNIGLSTAPPLSTSVVELL